jgi:hypothetical protein
VTFVISIVAAPGLFTLQQLLYIGTLFVLSQIMRTILTISICIFAFGTSSKCQTNQSIREIELSKVSRGYEEHIRVNADSLYVLIENRKGEKSSQSFSRKITADEWTALVTIVKEVKLKDIPALAAPTMKRASDAAMHATLTVNTEDGKSYSHGYDDEDPHEALQPLRKAIRELSSQK